MKIIIGVKFDNSDFLLHEKQFIIVANHNSHLDTMALMASLPEEIIHRVKPVAAKDYFGKTKFQEKFSNYFINTLLIKRSTHEENQGLGTIRQMINVLDKGYSLIIFPEGTRGEPEIMQPLKKGVAFVIAERPEIKFVPVFMYGMGKALPKGDGLILPYSSLLTFGEPQEIKNKTDKTEILKQIESELLKLKEKSFVTSEIGH